MWVDIDPPKDITDRGFYLGTGGYHFEDWEGKFYPPEVKAELQKLSYYQTYFPFTEIAHTFSQPAQRETFGEIERMSTGDTAYAIRLHRDLLHGVPWDLERGAETIRQTIAAASSLIETGRLFSLLMLVPNAATRSQSRLDHILKLSSQAIKRRIDLHVEFQHSSWHEHHVLRSLRDAGVGISNPEIPLGNAFPLKSYATTDKGYIRYGGLNFSGSRGRKKETRFDYLYSEAEIEARLSGQVALSRKVSHLAIVYNNCPGRKL